MSEKIRSRDLRIRHQCEKCGTWITAHGTLWGSPSALLKVAFCENCQSSYFGVDGMGDNAAPAVMQLVGHLLKSFPGQGQQSVH